MASSFQGDEQHARSLPKRAAEILERALSNVTVQYMDLDMGRQYGVAITLTLPGDTDYQLRHAIRGTYIRETKPAVLGPPVLVEVSEEEVERWLEMEREYDFRRPSNIVEYEGKLYRMKQETLQAAEYRWSEEEAQEVAEHLISWVRDMAMRGRVAALALGEEFP